jgi:Arc/MetJ-type ribon-helix-helix transcriptional regulator
VIAMVIRSFPISAKISEDLKNYLEKLVDRGIAINTSEAVKICVRYAKQKKMEEEI